MKLLNFENWNSSELSKLGIILENKVNQKLMLSNNANNKISTSKFVFFYEKNRNFWMISDF